MKDSNGRTGNSIANVQGVVAADRLVLAGGGWQCHQVLRRHDVGPTRVQKIVDASGSSGKPTRSLHPGLTINEASAIRWPNPARNGDAGRERRKQGKSSAEVYRRVQAQIGHKRSPSTRGLRADP
jgi:hypothetical protein